MHDEKKKNDYGDHLLSHQPVAAILNKSLLSLNNLQKTDHVSPGPHLGKQNPTKINSIICLGNSFFASKLCLSNYAMLLPAL